MKEINLFYSILFYTAGAEPALGGGAPVFGAALWSLWGGGGQHPGRADNLPYSQAIVS